MSKIEEAREIGKNFCINGGRCVPEWDSNLKHLLASVVGKEYFLCLSAWRDGWWIQMNKELVEIRGEAALFSGKTI